MNSVNNLPLAKAKRDRAQFLSQASTKGRRGLIITCAFAALLGFISLGPTAKVASQGYEIQIISLIFESSANIGDIQLTFSSIALACAFLSLLLFFVSIVIQFFASHPIFNSITFILSGVLTIPIVIELSGIGRQLDAVLGKYYATFDLGLGALFPIVFGCTAAFLCLLQKPSVSLFVREKKVFDKVMKIGVYAAAALTVVSLIGILSYILINGIPGVFKQGFLTRTYEAAVDSPNKGIAPMIFNTIYLVLLSLLITLPIGICTAIYLTQYAKKGNFVKIIRFTAETLAGIPSIIYGLFGFAFFVTFCKFGYSILAGALTLSIMILPTVIRTTEEALLSVPKSYKEGGLALGAGKLRVLATLVLPSAMPGVLTAVILATGRIVGETAALIFTAGIVVRTPMFSKFADIFSYAGNSGRSLAVHMYQTAMLGGEGANDHVFATASVLLIIVFCLNLLSKLVVGKRGRK